MVYLTLFEEMKREIIGTVLFLGLVYCLNFFMAISLFTINDNFDQVFETKHENDSDNETASESETEKSEGMINLDLLKSKKETLKELNIKLTYIKNMIQEIKSKINTK